MSILESAPYYVTETYADGEFRVDIVQTREYFEAWLYHKDYGVKSMMFGMSVDDQFTKADFIHIVEMHLLSYEADYAEKYCDEEEVF